MKDDRQKAIPPAYPDMTMSKYEAAIRQPLARGDAGSGLVSGSPRGRDQPRPDPQTEGGIVRSERRLPVAIKLFLIGLAIPWIIPLGPLNLSAYRVVLIVALLPCLSMWMKGKAGPVRTADIGLHLYSIWAALALVVIHGVGPGIQSGGMLFIEGTGAYMLARCYIRSADDFRNMIIFVIRLMICLLPFALYEWVTGEKPLLVLFGAIFPTVEVTKMVPRMGLWRVQGPFSHSILFGVFCGSMLALTCLVSSEKPWTRRLLGCLVGGTAILSMSSAPIAGVVVQIALLTWNRILHDFKWRWKLLWALAFIGYLVVEFGSNQTPVQFYVSHFTFEQQTGWYRIWIWDYGSASVSDHPVFGIGLGDWARPVWMASDSVDNFWLLTAMRYGLPAFLFMTLSWLLLWIAVARKKGLDRTLRSYRTAYLICMATFVFVGSTVHFWGATYAWFFFLGGSGVWLLDAGSSPERSRSRARPNGSRVLVSTSAAGRSPRPQAEGFRRLPPGSAPNSND
jgi:O-antigen ligase